MTAGPDMVHNVIVAAIQHQVPYAHWRALTTQDLSIPGEPSEPQPDLVVFERGAVRESGRLLPSGAVTLVVEVVSKTSGDRDYRTKRGMYAAGRIPAYLLVDPTEGVCVLFTEPVEENAKGLPDYRSERTSGFGEPVAVDVLGITLDTTDFQALD